MDEFLKQDLEGSAGLDEALNWVGAVLGPVEAALIRLKFNAMAQGTEEKPAPAVVGPGEALMSDDPLVRSKARAEESSKQDQADAHAAQAGIDNGRNVDRFLTAEMREFRADLRGGEGSKRSREERMHTLRAVLNNQRLAEKLRDTYKAFDDTRDQGRELLEEIAAVRTQIQRGREYLLAQHTARHPVTKEPLIRYKDGRIKDAKGTVVEPEEVMHIPPESMVPGERWDALERWEIEADQLEVRARNGMKSLDRAETKMEDGIKADPDKAEEHMTEGKKTQESVAGDFEDIGEQVKEIQRSSAFSTDQAVTAPREDTGAGLAPAAIGRPTL